MQDIDSDKMNEAIRIQNEINSVEKDIRKQQIIRHELINKLDALGIDVSSYRSVNLIRGNK